MCLVQCAGCIVHGAMCMLQSGIKYFALWEPHLVGQYFAHDNVINGLAEALQALHLSLCHKESFSAR